MCFISLYPNLAFSYLYKQIIFIQICITKNLKTYMKWVMLSSRVCLKSSIQKHKVSCWHGDRGRVRVGVCEVGRTTDNIRNVGCVLIGREGWEGGGRGERRGKGGEKGVYTCWEVL